MKKTSQKKPAAPTGLADTTGSTSLRSLGEEINAINRANGWDVMKPFDWPCADEDDTSRQHKVRKVLTALALIHSEVSEALEAVRHDDRANFDEELADVLIRVLDVATGLGTDLDREVEAKLAKNRNRGFRHGGKAV